MAKTNEATTSNRHQWVAYTSFKRGTKNRERESTRKKINNKNFHTHQKLLHSRNVEQTVSEKAFTYKILAGEQRWFAPFQLVINDDDFVVQNICTNTRLNGPNGLLTHVLAPRLLDCADILVVQRSVHSFVAGIAGGFRLHTTHLTHALKTNNADDGISFVAMQSIRSV